MPRTTPHRGQPPTAPPAAAITPRGAALTRSALLLAAALVLARTTMLETLRNPLEINPGSEPVPRGPGAGTGLLLDLLACLPALLVLARRVIDPTFRLRFGWSFVPMALLATWALASVFWAADKFAAVVSASHWLAAMVFLWAVAQLVRDWLRLRFVAAVCFGLLLVQSGNGFYYRYVEHPDLRREWEKNKTAFLQQRGWEPGSFHARQFENRVLSGEVMGFTSSPNSYAAVLVLLTAVAGGLLAQRLSDRDGVGWAVGIGLVIALSVLMIWFIRSRTAYATVALGFALFAGVWLLRGWLARHARLAYFAGVVAVFGVAAAVVGHGLYHGTLFHDSLTFRWRYWVASAKLFAAHPLVGVGWDNFGPHYLAHRLPIAAEEIRDPHNFVVRFATELGAVGLALLLAWMLRLWWELTRPVPAVAVPSETVRDDSDPSRDGNGDAPVHATDRRRIEGATTDPIGAPAGTIAAVGVAGVLLNVLASVDWTQTSAFVAVEMIRRLGVLCLFLVGAAAVATRSFERQELDDRPAPWVAYGALIGLGLFLLHNLLDFSLFEPGPMLLFAFVCGAALGIRLRQQPQAAPRGTAALAAVTVCTLLWLLAAGGLAGPVITAENAAADADEALRRNQYGVAAAGFERAFGAVPYNADYAYRAARAHLFAGRPSEARRLLDRAIATDPNRGEYHLARVSAEAMGPDASPARARADFERAIHLDPNNVQVRLDYARLLTNLGDRPAAAEQFRIALRYNDQLHSDEPKRLTAEQVREVEKSLAALGA